MSSKENYSAREFSGEPDQGLRPQPVTFSTIHYRNAHGIEPRGRGSWAFSFNPAHTTFADAWFAPPLLTYVEAKRAARAEARQRGARVVWVLP